MKLKYTILLSVMTVSLSACSLQDVDHKWCPPEQSHQILLEADALFTFDKSAEKDILEAGKVKLDELAYKLNNEFINIESIHLTGHTDHLGSDSYNLKLGLQRADTVKGYLETKGVKSPITTSSKGENEPIVKCEKILRSKELKVCLQPNRRVVVDIKGLSLTK